MNAHQRRVARRRSRNHKFGPLMTLTPAEQSALLACLQPMRRPVYGHFGARSNVSPLYRVIP